MGRDDFKDSVDNMGFAVGFINLAPGLLTFIFIALIQPDQTRLHITNCNPLIVNHFMTRCFSYYFSDQMHVPLLERSKTRMNFVQLSFILSSVKEINLYFTYVCITLLCSTPKNE